MRRFFRKIHLWISVPVGLIISITCFTGAILVFEKEILALAHPHLYSCEVPEGQTMMTGEEIAKVLNASDVVVPGADGTRTEVANVRLPDRENGCAMVTFKGGGRKALSVNPYTGEINGWVERSGFFTAVRQLHRWLMDIPAAKGEKDQRSCDLAAQRFPDAPHKARPLMHQGLETFSLRQPRFIGILQPDFAPCHGPHRPDMVLRLVP